MKIKSKSRESIREQNHFQKPAVLTTQFREKMQKKNQARPLHAVATDENLNP